MTAFTSAYASVVSKCSPSRSAIAFALRLFGSLKRPDITADESRQMTTEVSGIPILLQDRLRGALGNRDRRRNACQAFAGKRLHDPLLHQTVYSLR